MILPRMLAFLLIASVPCAGSSWTVIGGPEIAVEGDCADLTEFHEVVHYEPPFGSPPFEAYSNTIYRLTANAYLDFWLPVDVEGGGFSLRAFGTNLTAGMRVELNPDDGYGALELEWLAPYVMEATDFTFSCGVQIVDGEDVLETLARTVTVTVLPALPQLSENLLSNGFRIRDGVEPAEIYLELTDPDETIEGDELLIENDDPRFSFQRAEGGQNWWTLRWNDARALPVVSELVPLRFWMRDFDGSATRSTPADRELMIFGQHYEDSQIAAPDPTEPRPSHRTVATSRKCRGRLGARVPTHCRHGRDGCPQPSATRRDPMNLERRIEPSPRPASVADAWGHASPPIAGMVGTAAPSRPRLDATPRTSRVASNRRHAPQVSRTHGGTRPHPLQAW